MGENAEAWYIRELEEALRGANRDAKESHEKIDALALKLEQFAWHKASAGLPTVSGPYLVAERVHGAWCVSRAHWLDGCPGLWKGYEMWWGPIPAPPQAHECGV